MEGLSGATLLDGRGTDRMQKTSFDVTQCSAAVMPHSRPWTHSNQIGPQSCIKLNGPSQTEAALGRLSISRSIRGNEGWKGRGWEDGREMGRNVEMGLHYSWHVFHVLCDIWDSGDNESPVREKPYTHTDSTQERSTLVQTPTLDSYRTQ